MWETVKSSAVVVFITILIWFAADRNVRETDDFRIPVRIVSDGPFRYAAFAKPPNLVMFDVSVTGRRKDLKDFSELVESKQVFDALIAGTSESGPRPRALSGREIVGMIKTLSLPGVSIVSVEPSSAPVIVDRFETVADVRVVPNFGELKVFSEPTPTRVSVRLPAFAAARLRADPIARADAEQRILAARKPDGSFTIKAPLSFDALKDLDPDMRIEVVPAAEVTITGQIEALTSTARKGPIQITWSVPHQVQEEFRIVVDPTTNFRPDIDVTGPKELVEQLDPRDIMGLVEVLSADMEKPGAEIRRKVRFILPGECALAPGSPPYEIAFQLEPRAEPISRTP